MANALERCQPNSPEIVEVREFYSLPLRKQVREKKGIASLLNKKETSELKAIYSTRTKNLKDANYDLEMDTAEYAEEIHSGQTRKNSSVPYFHHPISMAILMEGSSVQRSGILLHDAQEDKGVSREQVLARLAHHAPADVENIALIMKALNHTRYDAIISDKEKRKEKFYQDLEVLDAIYPNLGLIEIKFLDTIYNLVGDLVQIHNLRTDTKSDPEIIQQKLNEVLIRTDKYCSKAEGFFNRFKKKSKIKSKILWEGITLAKEELHLPILIPLEKSSSITPERKEMAS